MGERISSIFRVSQACKRQGRDGNTAFYTRKHYSSQSPLWELKSHKAFSSLNKSHNIQTMYMYFTLGVSASCHLESQCSTTTSAIIYQTYKATVQVFTAVKTSEIFRHKLCIQWQKIKGNAIPLTGHEGALYCETSRLPHFLDNRLTDGGEIVCLTLRPPFTSQEDSWYSFLLRGWVDPWAIVRLEGLGQLKNPQWI
jgi:hypothetical protein